MRIAVHNHKSQLISMDLILAFLIYVVALSFFFYSLKSAPFLNDERRSMHITADFVFSNLEKNLPDEYSFLEGYTVYEDRIDRVRSSYPYYSEATSSLLSSSLGNITNPVVSADFSQMDVCIYVEEGSTGKIVKDIGAGMPGSVSAPRAGYEIYVTDSSGLNGRICGKDPLVGIDYRAASCLTSPNVQAIVVSKPVLYIPASGGGGGGGGSAGGRFLILKALICAK